MSIVKTTETIHGIQVPDAIHRIENMVINTESMRFWVRSYKSIDLPFFSEEIHTCEYDINGENPFKQAYTYLKKTDRFSGAVDS